MIRIEFAEDINALVSPGWKQAIENEANNMKNFIDAVYETDIIMAAKEVPDFETNHKVERIILYPHDKEDCEMTELTAKDVRKEIQKLKEKFADLTIVTDHGVIEFRETAPSFDQDEFEDFCVFIDQLEGFDKGDVQGEVEVIVRPFANVTRVPLGETILAKMDDAHCEADSICVELRFLRRKLQAVYEAERAAREVKRFESDNEDVLWNF